MNPDGLDFIVRPDEQCIALTSSYRLFQKRKGHRYSVDDMLVAHLAGTRAVEPKRVLDLGCGLGSVMLIVGWAFPEARLVGLEAEHEHVELARRNVSLNDCQRRARVVFGDLRDLDLVSSLGIHELVTGSPPYFDPKAATVCKDPARAAAHFELRGGIEAYALAASRALAPGGLFVTCASAEPEDRARRALASAGLAIDFERPVIPRAGKPPFLTLLVASKGPSSSRPEASALVLRTCEGLRTKEHAEIRRWTGVDCSLR